MIIKVIEVLSHSPNSWEEAAQNAVTEASRSVREIKSIYIKEFSAKVKDNKIAEYRVNAKISFVVD